MSSGYSLLVLGPSGSGKSTLAYSALLHEGGGAVLMAPGDDEWNSYADLADDPAYQLLAVDDPDWAPSMGRKAVQGLTDAGAFLRSLLDNPPPVLVIDTINGIGQLVVNYTMKRTGLVEPPAAMSPDGARYYSGIRNGMEDFMRMVRAVRGKGVHVIATSHIQEKELAKTSMATSTTSTAYVPLLAGSYRELLPAVFDVVVHAGVNPKGDPAHYVQWVPSPKRPTKSRVGDLGAATLPNDWRHIKQAIDTAIKARQAARQGASRAASNPANS